MGPNNGNLSRNAGNIQDFCANLAIYKIACSWYPIQTCTLLVFVLQVLTAIRAVRRTARIGVGRPYRGQTVVGSSRKVP